MCTSVGYRRMSRLSNFSASSLHSFARLISLSLQLVEAGVYARLQIARAEGMASRPPSDRLSRVKALYEGSHSGRKVTISTVECFLFWPSAVPSFGMHAGYQQ